MMIAVVIGAAVAFAIGRIRPLGRIGRRLLFLGCVLSALLIAIAGQMMLSDRC
ncbi:hypothetical protein EV668_0426 [Enterovirga rhinocerotis]|uniref:Uncharacterized protein n=2 Tax=Enterovirga rhinocerotis TaxID=1339210 RepID=A0A4R7C5K3_9HYPH|nr:hypothetical protein EV668_0426 [Enterovirga rhinocerotis]